MTTEELCNLVSSEIGKSFNSSLEIIQEELLKGATHDMTEQEVYAHMFLQSILISTNLSAQVVMSTLVAMDVIPSEMLSSLKVKPQLHLVKYPAETENPDPNPHDREE